MAHGAKNGAGKAAERLLQKKKDNPDSWKEWTGSEPRGMKKAGGLASFEGQRRYEAYKKKRDTPPAKKTEGFADRFKRGLKEVRKASGWDNARDDYEAHQKKLAKEKLEKSPKGPQARKPARPKSGGKRPEGNPTHNAKQREIAAGWKKDRLGRANPPKTSTPGEKITLEKPPADKNKKNPKGKAPIDWSGVTPKWGKAGGYPKPTHLERDMKDLPEGVVGTYTPLENTSRTPESAETTKARMDMRAENAAEDLRNKRKVTLEKPPADRNKKALKKGGAEGVEEATDEYAMNAERLTKPVPRKDAMKAERLMRELPRKDAMKAERLMRELPRKDAMKAERLMREVTLEKPPADRNRKALEEALKKGGWARTTDDSSAEDKRLEAERDSAKADPKTPSSVQKEIDQQAFERTGKRPEGWTGPMQDTYPAPKPSKDSSPGNWQSPAHQDQTAKPWSTDEPSESKAKDSDGSSESDFMSKFRKGTASSYDPNSSMDRAKMKALRSGNKDWATDKRKRKSPVKSPVKATGPEPTPEEVENPKRRRNPRLRRRR